MTTTDALLVFSNGTILRGVAWGAKGVTTGSVVVDSSISGYEDALRAAGNSGRIVLATSPHIGNVGVRGSAPYIAGGLIVRDPSQVVSNWTAEGALEPALEAQKVVGIAGIDTRAVVRLLNANPGIRAGIFSGIALPETVRSLEHASEIPATIQTELVNRVVESEQN